MERHLGTKTTLSYGTANIFDVPDFDIKKWPNVLYVNLRTLFRNYVASIHKDDRKRLSDKRQFLSDFLDEVTQFEHYVRELSRQRIRIVFFYPSYQSLYKKLPLTERKEYNPNGFDEVEEKMWEYVKKVKLMVPFHYIETDTDLPPSHEAVLLLSSFAVDLLSEHRVPSLKLLESYTGKIKDRRHWNTKINLSNHKSKHPIEVPFNAFTLQVFGDKSGALKGASPQLRRAVREVALTQHWSSITTLSKIRVGISRISNPDIRRSLLQYL